VLVLAFASTDQLLGGQVGDDVAEREIAIVVLNVQSTRNLVGAVPLLRVISEKVEGLFSKVFFIRGCGLRTCVHVNRKS